MNTKQKYVRLKDYNQIIIFNVLLEHSYFKQLEPVSAGFCYINNNTVSCFGKSTSLSLQSLEDDSYWATKQLFGYDAADALKIL